MNFLKKLFDKKKEEKIFTEEELGNFYEQKEKGLENVLGKLHNIVGHAIIPFKIGGAVDMYYYLNGVAGTGFATMELIKPDGSGPIPNESGTYELVGFTKHEFADSESEETYFHKIERRFCNIFTAIGNFSSMTKLQSGDTCEIPAGENEPNHSIIFDNYEPHGKEFHIGNSKHHLLLVIELFNDEMNYAKENGSQKLFEKLKEHGYYPYSDLDRKSVISN
jgi:hypothetical protein